MNHGTVMRIKDRDDHIKTLNPHIDKKTRSQEDWDRGVGRGRGVKGPDTWIK